MLLTAADYPSVRAVLDITLDADSLPDSIIELPVYAGSAEADVAAKDPLYATRTGTDKLHIRNALILFCAARIAPAMPSITAETQGPYVQARSPVDWMKRQAELTGRAESEIAAVLTPTQSTVKYPTFFTTGYGTRGR